MQSLGLFADYAFLFVGTFGSISQGTIVLCYEQDQQVLHREQHNVKLCFPLSTYPPPPSLDHLAQLIQLSGGSLVSSIEAGPDGSHHHT